MSKALEYGKTQGHSQENIDLVAKAINDEWEITPWGDLGGAAERALWEDPREALRFLAIGVLDALL